MDSPETIQKIIDVAAPTEIDYISRKYTSKPVHLLVPPAGTPVPVSTLQGLVDLYAADLNEVSSKSKVLLHITSPWAVQMISKDADPWERYRVFAEAAYPKACQQFPYGKFLDPEEFIILAQVCFQRVKIENDDGTMEKDLDYVLKIASAISAGKEQTNADDGISQTVQMKAGVTLKTTETLRPIVNLAPYRTFAEIDQIVSRFIFRAHGDEEGAQLALFEADGGRWRLGAVSAIAAWLKAKFSGTAVPVIS
jgi:hypothetical protein